MLDSQNCDIIYITYQSIDSQIYNYTTLYTKYKHDEMKKPIGL